MKESVKFRISTHKPEMLNVVRVQQMNPAAAKISSHSSHLKSKTWSSVKFHIKNIKPFIKIIGLINKYKYKIQPFQLGSLEWLEVLLNKINNVKIANPPYLQKLSLSSQILHSQNRPKVQFHLHSSGIRPPSTSIG
jgi:hypothetical protein